MKKLENNYLYNIYDLVQEDKNLTVNELKRNIQNSVSQYGGRANAYYTRRAERQSIMVEYTSAKMYRLNKYYPIKNNELYYTCTARIGYDNEDNTCIRMYLNDEYRESSYKISYAPYYAYEANNEIFIADNVYDDLYKRIEETEYKTKLVLKHIDALIKHKDRLDKIECGYADELCYIDLNDCNPNATIDNILQEVQSKKNALETKLENLKGKYVLFIERNGDYTLMKVSGYDWFSASEGFYRIYGEYLSVSTLGEIYMYKDGCHSFLCEDITIIGDDGELDKLIDDCVKTFWETEKEIEKYELA